MSLMYKYIRTKKIKVNRKRTSPDYCVQAGDVIDFFIKDEFFAEKEDYSFTNLICDISVVYEDENILIADKRPGVIVHSDEKEERGTLIDQIKCYLYNKGEYNPADESSFAPALCNRIDRNTGGMVICAKNAATLREVNEMIREGRVTKKYLALVHGIFDKKSGELKNFLFKDRKSNIVYVKDRPEKGCVTAITKYRVVKESKERKLTLIEAELITGRTHQIRAQFAAIGHPLMGDGKYGVNRDDKKLGYKYQALYSYYLRFNFEKDKKSSLSYLDGKTFKVDDVFFKKEI